MSCKRVTVVLFVIIGLYSCGNSQVKAPKEKPLNISIFLDLSDRLVKSTTPSQKEKDIAIVKDVCEYFKEQTKGTAILTTENHLKVLFYPIPNNSSITSLAGDLDVDMASIEPAKRMPTLNGLSDKFSNNLSQIYDKTISEKNWIGCDIFNFFDSKKVDQLCVRNGARNILIILTDGYIYMLKVIKKKMEISILILQMK